MVFVLQFFFKFEDSNFTRIIFLEKWNCFITMSFMVLHNFSSLQEVI